MMSSHQPRAAYSQASGHRDVLSAVLMMLLTATFIVLVSAGGLILLWDAVH